jgi:hypothetical protein
MLTNGVRFFTGAGFEIKQLDPVISDSWPGKPPLEQSSAPFMSIEYTYVYLQINILEYNNGHYEWLLLLILIQTFMCRMWETCLIKWVARHRGQAFMMIQSKHNSLN